MQARSIIPRKGCEVRAVRANAPICLNMIVKNEAAILDGCLQSALPVIDYCVICDTGSSDATVDVIERFSARHQVPGEVHRIPFVNFEVARNEALDLCRSSAAGFEYILLLDADMEVHVETPDFARQLSEPAYMIRQTNSISYFNTRLVRRDCPAKYVGVTHEYLATDPYAKRFEGLWCYDHACGANRINKFERDIELLSRAIAHDPHDRRALFYLAQSYMDAGRHAEAIDWYEKRIASGGWAEETWYSMYRLALCHAQLGNVTEFRETCQRAHQFRPSRREPLYSLANHYRILGDYQEAMNWCEAAERIPYPSADALFIQDYVYHAGIQEEMSIAGYYCEDQRYRDKGYEACLTLTTSRQAGRPARANALRNVFHYLKSAAELFGGCELKEIAVPGIPWPATNPSIWIDEQGRHCILRSLNYLVSGGRYHILDQDQVIRTQNYFLSLDDGFAVRDCRALKDLAASPAKHAFPVKGFEDCRLFSCRGRFWCTCTVRDRNSDGTCQIAILALDDDRNAISVDVVTGPHPDRHQKNWVPMVASDELFLIYSSDPTIVLHYDFERRTARVVSNATPKPCLEFFRGSSQAIRIKDGWLYVTHEAKQIHEQIRSYQHRFVLMDEDFQLKGYSEPFYFLDKGIEFCAGLGYDAATRRFVASFGVNDCGAYLGFFDEEAVLSRIRACSAW
ncbi:MAG: tetratricopeptide repeat protein [Planctomycetes bacterium]|nr:tetratricopeptide repeat protein [Planctomycetota bacterium]